MSNFDETKKNTASEAENTAKTYPAKAPTAEPQAKATAPAAASDDREVVNITISEDDEKVDNVVKLSKIYNFEGKEIEEIDLSGLEGLTGAMSQKIESLYRKITKNISAQPELTLDYAMATASILTDLPVEFFKQIGSNDLTKIKSRIINFLYAD